jgi:hypothetical protein
MLYGTPEKSSVDFLLMILQNVGLRAKNTRIYIFFPTDHQLKASSRVYMTQLEKTTAQLQRVSSA